MMNDDDVVVARASGRETVEELRSSGALDALFERLDAGEIEMTGSQGLLPALLKEALERGLAAELSEHLGYEKGQTSTQARSNTRRGTTKKTVISEVGAFEIEVPRDRAGALCCAGTYNTTCGQDILFLPPSVTWLSDLTPGLGRKRLNCMAVT